MKVSSRPHLAICAIVAISTSRQVLPVRTECRIAPVCHPGKLGVDFVNRGVIFPVGNKDAVKVTSAIVPPAVSMTLRMVSERGGFAPLGHRQTARCYVDQSQRTGDIHHAISQRAGNEGASGALLPAGIITDFGIVKLLSDTSKGRGRKRVTERFDVADQPKKVSILNNAAFCANSGPAGVLRLPAPRRNTPEKSRRVRRFDADVGSDTGENQMAYSTLRKMLSSGVLKKPL